jgi:hypothetical protein
LDNFNVASLGVIYYVLILKTKSSNFITSAARLFDECVGLTKCVSRPTKAAGFVLHSTRQVESTENSVPRVAIQIVFNVTFLVICAYSSLPGLPIGYYAARKSNAKRKSYFSFKEINFILYRRRNHINNILPTKHTYTVGKTVPELK